MRSITHVLHRIRPHAGNVFWSNANTFTSSAFGLLTSALLFRVAGKEVYGKYLFVLGIFGLLSVFSIPGVRTVIFRTIAQGSDGVYGRATRFSFIWSLTGIPLLLISGSIVYFYKAHSSGIALMLSAFFFPAVTSLQTWIPFLKAKATFKKLFLYNLSRFLVKLIALVCVLSITKNLIVIVMTHFLAMGGLNILYYFSTLASRRNNIVEIGWRKQSYALTVMDMSGLAFGQMDIVLLGFLLSFESLAIYGAVMRVGTLFFQVIRSSIEGVLPSLFRSTRIQLSDFYKLFGLMFLIPIALYPIIRFPLGLIYGNEASELVVYCRVYLLVIPVFFLNSITASFMIKYQLNKEINISRISGIVVVLILYSCLIPQYGIWGGVVSSMLFYVLLLLMNLVLIKTAQLRPTESQESGPITGNV